MDVIGRIRQLMDERGWTAYRLGKAANISPSTLKNIFSRGTHPSIVTLESICAAFNITLSQFFAEGSCVNLSEEQEDLLKHWSLLSQKQRQLLIDVMEQMSTNKF